MSAITTADYLAQHGEALEAAIGAAARHIVPRITPAALRREEPT